MSSSYECIPGNILRVTWSRFCIAREVRFNGLMLGDGSYEGVNGKGFLRLRWIVYFLRCSACYLKMLLAVLEACPAARRVRVFAAQREGTKKSLTLYCGSSLGTRPNVRVVRSFEARFDLGIGRFPFKLGKVNWGEGWYFPRCQSPLRKAAHDDFVKVDDKGQRLSGSRRWPPVLPTGLITRAGTSLPGLVGLVLAPSRLGRRIDGVGELDRI